MCQKGHLEVAGVSGREPFGGEGAVDEAGQVQVERPARDNKGVARATTEAGIGAAVSADDRGRRRQHGRTRRRDAADGKGAARSIALSFRGRIAVSFAIVAVLMALLMVVMLNIVWGRQFSTYTRENMENIASSASTTLAHEYDLRGYWSTSGLQSVLTIDDVFDGLGIQVLNAGGTLIYDNTWVDESGLSLAPDPSSMVSSPIVNDAGRQVGTVNVWAMGSDVLLTPRDINFQRSSEKGIFLAAAVGVVLAVVLGMLISRWLARPVRSITSAARRIKEGDLTVRSGVRGSDEVGQLGETFDDMAGVLEKDRDLERKLTSDVAHELRTPLMAIMATVEAMQDEVMPCDQEHLGLVDNEVKRLSRLVDSMLHLSRLESRSVKMYFAPLDCVEFLRGMLNSRKALFAEAGLDLEFKNETGAEEFTAELDHDTITQAVTNLLQNAQRYTPAPGTVTIGLAGDEDEVRISVSDTGVGISKDNIQRVFGRFWRAEDSRNRSKGGLGVGLAVTKEIIDTHHGHIDVESEVGVGTTFTLVLPRTQPTEDAAEA